MTSDTDTQALVTRVDELERQARRLKVLIVVFTLGMGATVLMAQARPDRVVEANGFVLKDSAGRVRARLAMEALDRPTLTYLDERGRLVASFSGGEEPFLALTRNGTNEQVQLAINKTLFGLAIYDSNTVRAGLAVVNGIPGLDLYGQNGKPRVSIEGNSASGGPSYITLFGEDGKSLWSAP